MTHGSEWRRMRLSERAEILCCHGYVESIRDTADWSRAADISYGKFETLSRHQQLRTHVSLAGHSRRAAKKRGWGGGRRHADGPCRQHGGEQRRQARQRRRLTYYVYNFHWSFMITVMLRPRIFRACSYTKKGTWMVLAQVYSWPSSRTIRISSCKAEDTRPTCVFSLINVFLFRSRFYVFIFFRVLHLKTLSKAKYTQIQIQRKKLLRGRLSNDFLPFYWLLCYATHNVTPWRATYGISVCKDDGWIDFKFSQRLFIKLFNVSVFYVFF